MTPSKPSTAGASVSGGRSDCPPHAPSIQLASQAPGWSAASFLPAVRVAAAAFGARRLNFAGNWFVLDEYGSYPAMLAAVRSCVAKVFDASDAREVWEGTARRLYRM